MASVHSPSDAFAHLQHHHNGLLGPSMQVRGHCTSLTSYSTLQLPASALWSHSPQPLPYITSLSFIRLCGLLVLLSCLVNANILAWAVSLQTVQMSVFIVDVSKHEKLSEACVILTSKVICHIQSMLFVNYACIKYIPLFGTCMTLHSHKSIHIYISVCSDKSSALAVLILKQPSGHSPPHSKSLFTNSALLRD